MEKRNERDDPESCWNKIEEDEPIFILRGRDMLASIAVDMWATLAEVHGVHPIKVTEAREAAEKMKRWPRRRLPT